MASEYLRGLKDAVSEVNKSLSRVSFEKGDERLYQFSVIEDDSFPPLAVEHSLEVKIIEKRK